MAGAVFAAEPQRCLAIADRAVYWLNAERLGGGSFDAASGSIMDMFNFNKANSVALILDPTFGTVDTKAKNKN
jgi:hypothetical protein